LAKITVCVYKVWVSFPFAMLMISAALATVDESSYEAARMDGAREWRIFRKVVLPIGLPAIASLAIFQFIWVWNDLLVALVFLFFSRRISAREALVTLDVLVRTRGVTLANKKVTVPYAIAIAFGAILTTVSLHVPGLQLL